MQNKRHIPINVNTIKMGLDAHESPIDENDVNDGKIHQKIEPITFSRSHNISKPVDKSIRAELEKCKFAPEIVEKAVELYQQNNFSTHRSQRRKQTLFYFALSAYNILGIPIEPKGLAEKCGMPATDISKSISQCSTTQKTDIPNIVIWSPIQFIEESYKTVQKQMDVQYQFPDNAYAEIIEMTEEILQKKPELFDQKPQMVAAASILFYLVIKGVKVDRKNYARLFRISNMTINKIYKQIDEAYNN